MAVFRRWLRRIWQGVCGTVGATLCVAFVVKDPAADFLPHWGSPVGVTMQLGVVLLVVGLAGAVLTKGFRRRDPLAGLPREERRARFDQVRQHHRSPVPAGDIPCCGRSRRTWG